MTERLGIGRNRRNSPKRGLRRFRLRPRRPVAPRQSPPGDSRKRMVDRLWTASRPIPMGHGLPPGYWGPLTRTVDGLEAALAWGTVAGNRAVASQGWKLPLAVARRVAGKPSLFHPGRSADFGPFQPGLDHATLPPSPPYFRGHLLDSALSPLCVLFHPGRSADFGPFQPGLKSWTVWNTISVDTGSVDIYSTGNLPYGGHHESRTERNYEAQTDTGNHCCHILHLSDRLCRQPHRYAG